MENGRIVIVVFSLAIALSACAGKKIETVYEQRDVIGEKIAQLQEKGIMHSFTDEEILMDEANFFTEKNNCTEIKLLFAYFFISEAKPDDLKAYWWSPRISKNKFETSINLNPKKLGNYYAYSLIANCKEISKAIKKKSAVTSTENNESLIPFNIDIEFKGEPLITLMIHPQVELWEKSEE